MGSSVTRHSVASATTANINTKNTKIKRFRHLIHPYWSYSQDLRQNYRRQTVGNIHIPRVNITGVLRPTAAR